MSAELRLYRRLLRLCRQADRRPTSLVTLFGRPPKVYSPPQRKIVRAPPSPWPFVEDAIWEANGGCTEFSQPVSGRTVAAAAVRKHRQRAEVLGLKYEREAEELLRRFSEAAEAAEAAIAASQGDEIEGLLEPALALQRVPPDDPAPAQVGDFLVTHPLACIFQPALDQSVVLLDDIDEKVGYVRGLVLNMPSQATLRHLVAAWPQGQDGDSCELRELEPLLRLALWRGGDLATAKGPKEDLHWLHAFGAEVPGAREVAPSVWEGGDTGVLSKLLSEAEAAGSGSGGGGKAELVRPLIGYCGWSRQQLALELERGVWVRARAVTPEAARALCLLRPEVGADEAQAAGAAAQKHVAVWRAALRAAGLHGLADFPRGLGVDDQLRELLNGHFRRRVDELAQSEKKMQMES